MCQDCGCNAVGTVNIQAMGRDRIQSNPHPHPEDRSHDHDRDHHHHHDHHHHSHAHGHSIQTLEIGQSVLQKNQRLAAQNRDLFAAHNLLVLNILSSPGSGKTTFLERTLTDLQSQLPAGAIVGDLATENDGERLRRSGAAVMQITTGTVCHLDAEMVRSAAQQLDLHRIDLLAIENVGNLVCPAAYDLGESLRVVLLSTTEGEDKPLKYPTAFKSADVAIVNKIDIAEAVGFEGETALANLQRMAPQAKIFTVSARTGEGMDRWYDYLRQQARSRVTGKLSALSLPNQH